MREMEARSSTTTTTIVETKNDLSAHPTRSSKRTLTDDLHTTFSTPMAWILVLALIVTWSAVAVIMFDLLDSKGLEGPQPHRVRKTFKEAGSLRGGIQHISSDPMKAVNEAMDDSTDWITSILNFMTNLVAPEEEEEEGERHFVRKKGEFLPPRKKVAEIRAKEMLEEEGEYEEEEEEEEDEEEEDEGLAEEEEEEEEEEDEEYEDEDEEEEEEDGDEIEEEEEEDEEKEEEEEEKELAKEAVDEEGKEEEAEEKEKEEADAEVEKKDASIPAEPYEEKEEQVTSKEAEAADDEEEDKIDVDKEPPEEEDGKGDTPADDKEKKEEVDDITDDDQSEEKDDDDEVKDADIAIALGIVADTGATVTDVKAQETGEEPILLKADGDSELLTTLEESAAKADDAVTDLADSQDGLAATDIPYDDHDDKIAKDLAEDHGEVTEDSLKDETGAGLKDADSEKDITSEGEGVIEKPELADDVADKEEQEGKEEGEEQIRGEDEEGDDAIIVTTPVVSSEPGGDETTVVTDEDDGSSPEKDIRTLKEEEKDEKDESAEKVEIAEKAPKPEPIAKAEEVKEKEAEKPVAKAEKEDKQKEPSPCPCMHSVLQKEPQKAQDTKPKEEKAEPDKVKKREAETKRREPLLKQRKEKEAPRRTRLEKAKKAPKAKAAAVNIPKTRRSRASEDMEVSAAPAPIQDLPMCRPTPVYCPAPPGWYVHHIVTSSPLPPSAIPESEVPILTTHQAPTLLKEPEPAKAKPKQATKKKEPAAAKEKAKAGPAKKEPTVTKAKVKPAVAKKGPIAVKERSKRTERVITKEKAKPTSTKKDPAVTKAAKVTTTSRKGKPVPDEKKTAEETKEKAAEAPAPAKDLKPEENVTEGKKPGKIPYFQCVLMSSKSSQYPLRPMSPAMSPAINPTMMRAMMEQRAALLQQKARAAGQ
uniref:Triadin n=1 Tax=Cyprinus carpio carpio TaxID=630221 RepID=A0A9J7Y1A7_CYPCA